MSSKTYVSIPKFCRGNAAQAVSVYGENDGLINELTNLNTENLGGITKPEYARFLEIKNEVNKIFRNIKYSELNQ